MQRRSEVAENSGGSGQPAGECIGPVTTMNALLESPAWLLAGYCVLAFLAAWIGGELPALLKLTHTRLQVAISFVAGLMLGLAMLGLLPHAAHALASPEKAGTWAAGGFLLMFLLQRFLPFHHHDVVEGNPLEPCGHTHSLAERSARNLSWAGVALGLSLHSVFDGLAMAAATATGEHGHGGMLGLGTALAVILHKPFGALAIATLMATRETSPGLRRRVIVAFASVTPLGALAFYLGAGPWAHAHPAWLGYALAFCSGTFLCIACADLLPELQFHSHDRLKLTAALLTGVGVALLVTRLGHEHPDQEHATTRSHGNRAELFMNRASVAAGVSPAVEGGVSPPGIPGSWTVSSSISNRARPVDQALHERQQRTCPRPIRKDTRFIRSGHPRCFQGFEPAFGRSKRLSISQNTTAAMAARIRNQPQSGTPVSSGSRTFPNLATDWMWASTQVKLKA